MDADFPYSDAHFELNNDELEIKLPKDLVCSSKNKIANMCVKPSCTKCSLHCNQDGCKSCSIEEHRKCVKIDMNGVTSLLNQHKKVKCDIMKRIGEMENNFFKALNRTNGQLKEELQFAGLGKKESLIVEKIYCNSNYACLKGQAASQFNSSLEEYSENKPCKKEINNILKQYEKKMNQMVEWATETKELLCNALNSKGSKSKNLFDSKILSMNQGHAEVLNNILSKTMKIQRVERLFRASEHGFRAKAFHKKCDDEQDTLVLIRTEFGKTIGGYTHKQWQSDADQQLQSEDIQEDVCRAFIFSLDMGEKFENQGDQGWISSSSELGPCFGEDGSDIYITDRCNKKDSQSSSSFPKIYNRTGKNKLKENQATLKKFSGGGEFRVEEYEVFRLFFQ